MSRPDHSPSPALRALSLALALVLLIPAALGGMSFVWCVPMRRAMLHACCPSERGHTHHADATIDAPCCEDRRIESMPVGDPPGATIDCLPVAAPTLWLTLAAIFPTPRRIAPRTRRPMSGRVRAGPSPPLYALNNARLC